jgi:biotin carboxyl carrier protein
VKVDGKTLKVKLSSDTLNLENAFLIEIDGRKYKIELKGVNREKPFIVKTEETKFNAQVKTPMKTRTIRIPEPTKLAPSWGTARLKRHAEGVVAAPMTGKILSIKVKKGDKVKTGQILCILEAMKMENEITAPESGTIKDLYVSEGMSVSEGAALILIG